MIRGPQDAGHTWAGANAAEAMMETDIFDVGSAVLGVEACGDE